jgi:REP element-mobilizing transposase RayT
MAKKFHVETCERAICGNHIHLAVRARDRKGFLDFLRAITGRIAQFVQKSGSQKLWESIPYTRIIAWGRHLKRLLSYIRKNALEAEGIIPYQPRTHRPRIPRSKLSKNLS